MGAITLERVEADESSIRCEFDYPRRLRGFFFETTFFTEYDADIGDVPESILVIPWVANVFPLALATGVDIEVSRLDERYAQSLLDAGRSLQEMYPQMVEECHIRCQQLVSNDAESGDDRNNALLFSGGVDAMDTYYRHREESPTLVSLHGFDVGLDDTAGWKEKERRITAFAQSEGLESFSIKTNIMSFLEDFTLNAHFRRFLQSDWYNAVHLGVGITGVTAPLAFEKQFDTMYMADSATETYDFKVGNDPSIVDSIAWGRTSVQSDGYEFTRQEKIENIAEFIRENDIDLHTCLEPGPGNCGECEKCLRTALGLLLVGLDPNRHGYQFDESDFEYTRRKLERGDWRLAPSKAFEWRVIQDHIHDGTYDYPGAEEFFHWLASVDIDRFVDPSNSSGFTAYKITRRLPPSALVHAARRRVLDVIW